jgi:hypothetical protein
MSEQTASVLVRLLKREPTGREMAWLERIAKQMKLSPAKAHERWTRKANREP